MEGETMFEVLTAPEMKRAERAAMAQGQTGLSLIEAAGQAAARHIMRHYESAPVLVLCGPGNNGADGFVVARILKNAGWPVRVACLAKKAALKGDSAAAARQWAGEPEMLNSNLSPKEARLVVDAVFGTGFKGALDPEIVTLFDKIRAKKIPVVAIDLPSGVTAEGAVAEGVLKAEYTVTFCRRKIAHMLHPARALCGKVSTAQIGIADAVIAEAGAQAFENNPALWLAAYPLPAAGSHKFTRGHAVVFGGARRTGAACLAAAAAQRIGAGLVSLTCQPAERVIYSSYRASLMVDVWQDLEEFKALLRDARKTAAVIGPGGGDNLRPFAEAALSLIKSCVLDGDVFTAYKDAPGELFKLLSPAHVLTPHEGEFVRLFGHLEGSKLDRARAAARIANAVIVYKGADTVIAAPDGTAVIHINSPSTLATAGAGDVLAGMIAGLAAQGMNPFFAACAAVWLHGKAAKNHGLGLVAEDIINQISHTLNELYGVARTDT